MRTLAFLSLLAIGCDGGGGESGPSNEQEQPVADVGVVDDAASPEIEPATFALYTPGGDEPSTFPDDFYTVASDSLTGLDVSITDANAGWLASVPGGYGLLYEQMNTLDGFGTSAAIFLRFDGPLADVEKLKDSVRLVDLGADLGAGVAVDVPFELHAFEEGRLLVLWPALPLRPATQHGVVAINLVDADGGPVGPSSALVEVFEGKATGRLGELAPRYTSMLEKTQVEVGQVSAATVFTTQSIYEHSGAIAAKIRDGAYEWSGEPDCVDARAGLKRCELTLTVSDFRDESGVADTNVGRRYELPVSVWVPRTNDGPWPVVIAGHGLGGDRSLGEFVATLTGSTPVAVVAIDAVGHGEHPGGRGMTQITQLIDFFEYDLAKKKLDGLALRDNFRQSTFDKLQLVEAIRQMPDFDADGSLDFDITHVTYFGASLGGIMGPEFVALSDAIGAAAFGIPGARLSQIMRDSSAFAPLVRTLVPANATDGDRERVFSAMQTVVERGDPMNFAPRVQNERLPGAGEAPPQVIVIMAIGDEIVPNSSTFNLLRALQAPVVPPIITEVDYIPTVESAPVSGNAFGATLGAFQYDRVTYYTGPRGQTETVAAGHESVMTGREAIYQFQQFHNTWLETGVAEIVDPFEHFGAPRE